MRLKDIVLQIIDRVGGKRESVYGQKVATQCFRYELLELIRSDGTKMQFPKDCEYPIICAAPINPAEAVWIEPREDGPHFVRRPAAPPAPLAEPPQSPATTTPPVDRQLPAAGEIAEKAEPSAVADHESELSARARRGRKPHDWELYRAKFYLMLDNDDVLAYADINISDYADRLMTWGRNNFDKSPEQAAMREKIAEWKPLWQRLKGASK